MFDTETPTPPTSDVAAPSGRAAGADRTATPASAEATPVPPPEVAALRAAVDRLVARPTDELAGPASEGRTQLVVEVAAQIERLEGLLVRAVGSWDAHGDWSVDGSLSPRAGLAHRTPRSRPDASRLVRDARLGRSHPEVADALAAGRIGTGHLTWLARAASGRRAELFERDLAVLLEAAERLDVDDFGVAIRRWMHIADDVIGRAPDPDREPQVTLAPTTGGWHLAGWLDPETGELVAMALERAVPPDPATHPGGPRTAGRRRADALRQIAESWLAEPSTGRVPVRMVVHVTLDALIRAGTFRTGVVDLPRLRADLERAGPIPVATLERLACDPHLERVVFAGSSRVVDVGRTTRVVSDALRRALVARDRCCQWPGCDRPASWCDAHHIVPWAQGGPTDLENLVLLCPAHHRMLHDERWVIRRDSTTGEVTVVPAPARRPPARAHDPPAA